MPATPDPTAPDLDAPDHVHDADDPACLMAHGDLVAPTGGRRLVLVFASPVADELAHLAPRLGYPVVLVEPDPERAPTEPVAVVPDMAGAALTNFTDVVVCDHERPELGDLVAAALAEPTRWLGVMGSLRHSAPHLVALRERGVPEDDIGRVHRPIGLDIGSKSPAEIAVATLAGLLADRNGRPGGSFAPGG